MNTTNSIDWSKVPSPSRLRTVGRRFASGTQTESDNIDIDMYLRVADQVARDSTTHLRSRLQRVCNVAGTGIVDIPNEPWLRVVPGRAKTKRTLIDKLRRAEFTGSLHNVRDVAGVRIVVYGGLKHQALVRAVAIKLLHSSTKDPKPIDRLSNPSYGYRALHAEVQVERMPLEIQVRTALQELWANIFEKLADDWGRQIRYGGAPDGNTDIAARCVELLGELSVLIAQVEDAEYTAQLLSGRQFTKNKPIGELIARKYDFASSLRPQLRDLLMRLSAVLKEAESLAEEEVN